MPDHADWLSRQYEALGREAEITDDHRKALNMLGDTVALLYNLNTPCAVVDAIDLLPTGQVSVLLRSELATYDSNQLTNLVVEAHRRCVRVSLQSWPSHLDLERSQAVAADLQRECGLDIDPEDPDVAIGVLELTLTPRDPAGTRWHDRHPGPLDLINSLETPDA